MTALKLELKVTLKLTKTSKINVTPRTTSNDIVKYKSNKRVPMGDDDNTSSSSSGDNFNVLEEIDHS